MKCSIDVSELGKCMSEVCQKKQKACTPSACDDCPLYILYEVLYAKGYDIEEDSERLFKEGECDV